MNFVNSMEWRTVPLVHEVGWKLPINAVLIYVAFVVLYIPYVMKSKKPVTFLENPVIIWNFILFAFNTTWAFWISFLLFDLLRNDGIHGVICDPNERFWKGQGMFVIWGFLMSKFMELGDTLFLALRKKPIIFLHWYHHITVLLIVGLLSKHKIPVVFYLDG